MPRILNPELWLGAKCGSDLGCTLASWGFFLTKCSVYLWLCSLAFMNRSALRLLFVKRSWGPGGPANATCTIGVTDEIVPEYIRNLAFGARHLCAVSDVSNFESCEQSWWPVWINAVAHNKHLSWKAGRGFFLLRHLLADAVSALIFDWMREKCKLSHAMSNCTDWPAVVGDRFSAHGDKDFAVLRLHRCTNVPNWEYSNLINLPVEKLLSVVTPHEHSST